MTFPALEQLLGAYLHQDFDLTGTIDENVDAFTAESPELATRLPAEVDELLRSVDSDEELDARLEQLGCQVEPEVGVSTRDWIAEIAGRVRAATT